MLSGPAAFVAHDNNPNCEFKKKSGRTVELQVSNWFSTYMVLLYDLQRLFDPFLPTRRLLPDLALIRRGKQGKGEQMKFYLLKAYVKCAVVLGS